MCRHSQRGSEEDTETETMTKATVAQLKEEFKESFALRELSVEKLFGKDGVKAKAFYACPKTGCSPVMSVDKVLTANNLSKSYEGFMNLHLEKHWMPVAEFNTDKSVKTILLMQHPQVGFLGKVREKGFKGAFEPSIGCSYIVSTDSSIQFEKESKKSE